MIALWLLTGVVANSDAGEPPVSVAGGGFGFSRKPDRVYRPFDRDIEAIQAVLEPVIDAPKQEEVQKPRPRRKRELIRKVTAEAVRILEGEGLIANAPVRQKIAEEAYQIVLPVFEAKPVDDSVMRAMIEAMLNQAAEAAYQQQLLEYQSQLAFEAEEDDIICLLLAA